MAAASTANLVDALRQNRLLEPAQLGEVVRLLQTCLAEPKALIAELIQRRWLTTYQANELLQGRGRDLLLGSYVLLEPLGEGGMGQVFKARNWKLGPVVALKLIRKERLDSPDAVRRFQREVRAASALHHPNIVMAQDADEINGAHLLVMEYIEGAVDLSALVKKNGSLPVLQACEIMRQAARGLQHAHERGLVHRDVKPHNLLLTADGKSVKILDMGLARLDDGGTEHAASDPLTKEGAVLGSADYLSPEQAMHMHTVDIRADLYSLGCTFYYLLAGRPPFAGGTFFEKVYRHRYEEPEPLEKLRPDAPPAVIAVVRKLIQKQPEHRYQTPDDVAAALEAVLQGGDSVPAGVHTTTTGVALDSPFAYTVEGGDTAAAARAFRRRRKANWGATLLYCASGGLSALIGAGLLVLLLFHLPPPPKPPDIDDKATHRVNAPSPDKDLHGDQSDKDLHNDPPPEAITLPPVMVQDFESGTYGDWTKTGTAFGDRPATGTLRGQQLVTGFSGKYLVNTFLDGDRSTGTLTSPEFTIRHSYIHFRIGGGDFPGRECINLRIDGKVVRTATGKSAEKLQWASWNVKAIKGQKAAIEIVDLLTGPWGHINIDDIMFADELPR